MTDNTKKPDNKKRRNAEKPVSFAGASFKDVMAGLLKMTKPTKGEKK